MKPILLCVFPLCAAILPGLGLELPGSIPTAKEPVQRTGGRGSTPAGTAEITAVTTNQPVCPVFLRAPFNPVLGFRIEVRGSQGTVTLEQLELGFAGTTRLQDIAEIQVVCGSPDPSAAPGTVVAENSEIREQLSLSCHHSLAPGEHWFWISTVLKEQADVDGRIDVSLLRIKAGNRSHAPAIPSPPGSQRIGTAVRLPGDDGSKAYRIPGLARSTAGTLLAVYDIRRDHAGDLPAHIDVGVSRSTDGGRRWEPMRVAIDLGADPVHDPEGAGDPAILVDPANGRIWIAALWSRGNRAWHGSGPGLTPEETGQLVLVHSDDDGKSWSQPVSITSQIKDPAWRLLLNGPGAGIALRDGTLVFAAQYRAADGPPHHGKPFSTLIWSNDHGSTWNIGTGVKCETTEAQLAELDDGSIMINCRDDRGGSRTIATTRDLGKTWQFHPTDRSALRESVCMASLLQWNHPQQGSLLWFSNPATDRGRHSLTIQLSRDQGMTWPEKNHRLYDSRHSFGYSCLAPVDPHHLGVLYEGKGSILFLRLPLKEWSD